MRRILTYTAVIHGLIVCACTTANAVTFDDLLGEQDFLDGQTPIQTSKTFLAGQGEPSPFNGVLFGDDRYANNFGDFSYTHITLASIADIVSATLTIGLIDHDSFDSVDTIDFFFDGIQQNDSAFIGISHNPSSASVVTVPVDISLLSDGQLVVRFISNAAPPSNHGNSIAPDFSLMSVQVIPEPATLALLGLPLLAYRNRR